MANILKTAKRGLDLQRITDGRVIPGERYADRSFEQRVVGVMPPLMYCATVTGKDGVEYTLQATEDEMISITSEWLTMMNRRRINAATAKRKQLDREQRASDTMEKRDAT